MRTLLAPVLASAAVMLMWAPAAAQHSPKWASCVNQGGAFSADQRINSCSSIIQSGRETGRNLAVAYYSRGLAYYDKGDDDRAIAEYNEAIRLDPKFAYAYSSRGLTYDHKGDLERASPDYDEAIRLDPKYAQALFNRGNAYYQKGDDDRAIADYNEAIRLSPKFAYAYNNRGTAFDHKGDDDRAIADFNEAIRLDPKFAQAYSNRGLANYQRGDFDRAIADYGEAIRLDPKYAYAYNNRGNAYYHKGDENRAIADYSEAIRLDPKYAQAYFNRGVTSLYAARLPNALGRFGSISRAQPQIRVRGALASHCGHAQQSAKPARRRGKADRHDQMASAGHRLFSRPNDAGGAAGHRGRCRRQDQTAQDLRGQFLQRRTCPATPRQRRGHAPVPARRDWLPQELHRARRCGCRTQSAGRKSLSTRLARFRRTPIRFDSSSE